MSIELGREKTGETEKEETAENNKSWLYLVSEETLQDALNLLAKCDCCVEHNKYKPVKFSDWWRTAYDCDCECECECDCRHLARQLCYRKWRDMDYPDNIDPNTLKTIQ